MSKGCVWEVVTTAPWIWHIFRWNGTRIMWWLTGFAETWFSTPCIIGIPREMTCIRPRITTEM